MPKKNDNVRNEVRHLERSMSTKKNEVISNMWKKLRGT